MGLWQDLTKIMRGNMATPRALDTMASQPGALAAQEAKGPMVQLGTTGLRQYGGFVREEFLRELSGRQGMEKYREMRDNDDIIGAALQAIESLLRGVDWTYEPVDENNPDDVEAAEFIADCIKNLRAGWENTLAEILSMLTFGWSLHEVLYIRRDDGRLGWLDWAIRAQETLMKWEWSYEQDRAVGMWQLPWTGGPMVLIPFSKALLFRTTTHKANPEGRSILRNAYGAFYRKKNIQAIEAIGIERDLAGLPVVYVPPAWADPNAPAEQRALFEGAKKLAREVKRDEQEGVVLPAVYDTAGNQILRFELLTANSRRQFDTNTVIARYNRAIAGTMLADFILLGQDQVGSFALSSNKTELFKSSLNYWLDVISETINRVAIPDILRLNAMTGQCNMSHAKIEKPDLDALGNFLQKVVGAGLLSPDEEIETHLRDAAGLPARAATQEGGV